MRIVMLCFLFTFLYLPTVRGQEIFFDAKSQDTCLFLGGIAEGNQFKVIENADIVFRKADDLTQVGLLTGNDFTDELFRQNLCFESEGYEPFWNVRIFRDTLILRLPDDDGEKLYKVRLHTNEESLSSEFFAMFSTECGSIFGTINYIGVSSGGEQRICEYNLADEASLYEVYINIRGKACKGCATIKNIPIEN